MFQALKKMDDVQAVTYCSSLFVPQVTCTTTYHSHRWEDEIETKTASSRNSIINYRKFIGKRYGVMMNPNVSCIIWKKTCTPKWHDYTYFFFPSQNLLPHGSWPIPIVGWAILQWNNYLNSDATTDFWFRAIFEVAKFSYCSISEHVGAL